MIIRCPACGAQTSLDILIDDQAAAEALRLALELAPLGPRLVRYLALFRPAKSRLTWPRVNALLSELIPAIRAPKLTRKGRTACVTEREWAAALDDVIAARDRGTLVTPLSGHGYLYDVAISKCARPWPDSGQGTVVDDQKNPAAPATDHQSPAPAAPASATARAIARLQARKRPTDEEGAA